MAVYVDALVRHPSTTKREPRPWCHMIADTLDELHAMAGAIGMRRAWFQPSPPASMDHYDLQALKRRRAVAAGAVDCDRRVFVGHMRRIRGR